MVSKAADKSSNTNKLPFPFPIVEAISFKTLKSAVSQLWPASNCTVHDYHSIWTKRIYFINLFIFSMYKYKSHRRLYSSN